MIETTRLRLRRCHPSDVDAVLAYRGRSDVAKYLSAGVWTRAKTIRELGTYETTVFDGPGDELVLLAEINDSRRVAGEVGLVWRDDIPDTAEIGYVFNPDFGGRGLATEAITALVQVAFDQFGFRHVMAVTDEANRASRALCERVGMRLLSTSIGNDHRRVPECTYEITRS